MNIAEYLPAEAVLADLKARNSDEVLAELAAPLLNLHPELEQFDLMRVLHEREELGSTAVGEGVAIPHGKVPGLHKPALAVGRSNLGIDFAAPDKGLCHLFFLILVPESGAGQHLRLLAQLARRVKDPVFRSELLLAENSEQLRHVLTAP
ncbi:PTS sugar transporter subunit IIA [Desulfovibrio sp. OttesenSCG-928-F20]|nr:PTS sugar transporter subunit IIA [Desulfovibrio sp. OttesenSCG-928-M16]MDL2290590.1 PTS sugar transporter subunit IIA [Desulfovibrio sp. OttesenSCG-928-F20]